MNLHLGFFDRCLFQDNQTTTQQNINLLYENEGIDLIKSSSNGDLETVTSLVKLKGINPNVRDQFGMTPLMHACANRHFKIIAFLIENRANASLTDNTGKTALMHSTNIVSRVDDQKGNVNLEKKRISVVTEQSSTSTVSLTIAPPQRSMIDEHKLYIEERLIKAVINNDIVSASSLIKFLSKEDLPMHFACSRNKSEIVELFLKSGFLIETRDADQKTPLMVACENGSLDVVMLLLEKGAKDDLVDNNGMTALMHAYSSGHLDIVGLF